MITDLLLTSPPLKAALTMPILAMAAESAPPSSAIILATVLLSLIVIYFASKAGGEICARINLPPVLGELVGGVIVGVSVTKLLVFPEAGATSADSLLMTFIEATAGLNPASADRVFESASEVISVLSELGVIILLFEIGLESDLKELLKAGTQATIVAFTGVVVPFVAGTAGLMYFFNVPAIPAIFAGAALTATSIGITAKVLSELGRLNTQEGKIIIGAAVVDDILGIIILAVVASLAEKGEIEVTNVIYLIVGASVFLVGSILLGRLLAPFFISLVNNLKTRGQLLISSMIFVFILSYIGDIIQLEAILGSFTAGLILAETEKRHELGELTAPIADLFTPIFFVVVGAKTDLGVLNPAIPSNREGLIIAAFLIVVAIAGKLVTGLTVFGAGPEINRVAVGVGMIPRGEVGLVFAGVGSASGVLSKPLEAAIIMMVILTTFLAPPFLRLAFNLSADSSTDSPAPALESGQTDSLRLEQAAQEKVKEPEQS